MIRRCGFEVVADSPEEFPQCCRSVDAESVQGLSHSYAMNYVGVPCRFCGVMRVITEEYLNWRGVWAERVCHQFDGMSVFHAEREAGCRSTTKVNS